MPSQSRGAGGPCHLCKQQYADLKDHIKQRHKTHFYTPSDLKDTTLVACLDCGTPCSAGTGLSRHKSRYCGLTLPPRVPTASQRKILQPTQSHPHGSATLSDDEEESTADTSTNELGVDFGAMRIQDAAEEHNTTTDELDANLGALRLDDNNGETAALVDEIEEPEASEDEIEALENAPEVQRKLPEAQEVEPVQEVGPEQEAEPEQEVEPEQEKENVESGGNLATAPVVQMNQEVDSTVSAPLGPCPRKSIPFTLPDQGNTADRFRYLATIPNRKKPIPGRLHPAFQDAAARCAEAYLTRPTEANLLNFLALPKVGLFPATLEKKPALFLASYPNVSWPTPKPKPQNPTTASDTSKTATKLVESGHLGSAARILAEDAKAMEIDDRVLEQLESKHPRGPEKPFGRKAGPKQGKNITEQSMREALDTFAADTAPGVSGWTVPLLKSAMHRPSVVKFLTTLCTSITSSTALGQSMLRTSRLIALKKDDGSVRPIAVGELIYRLCAKAILRSYFHTDFLLPYQLGVKSPGGVEPIVRAAERALEGSLGAEYTHLASLDATNAFNRVDRKVMADAVEKHAPVLWRTCKWAYGEPSDLICGDTILQSSQGVRQGDPFGPLFFSIALRPTLHALSIALGPDTQAVAYLDDIYLFSNDPNVMQRTQAFLADKENVIKLNNNKCKQVTFTEMAENGFKMLGTMVGPKKAREEFLKDKMESEARKIARLKDLPSQHALLLLRFCIQQNLRHLQRSLRTDDLKEYWEKMDQELWDEVQRMRTRQTEGSEAENMLGKKLSHLPARFGGLGLLSFTDVAPLANKAAAAQADKYLANIFALDLPDEAPTPSQRELCSSMWEHQQTAILEGLNDPGRKRLIENASGIGKRWLNVVPYFQPLRLSNQEVATGLHDRTLVGSSLAICSFCGSDSPLGHDELCRSRNSWAQRRHDSINRIIHRGLQSVEGAVVSIEPRTLEGQRRNDLRVRGRCGLHATDYDLKVYCLNDRDARSTTSAKPAASSLTNHVLNRCLSWLDKVSENATRKAPATHSGLFKAVVMSTGGIVSRETADEMRRWRREMGPMAFEGMMKKISLELVRARARTFAM